MTTDIRTSLIQSGKRLLIHGLRGSSTSCGKRAAGLLWANQDHAITCTRCLRMNGRRAKALAKKMEKAAKTTRRKNNP